MLGLKRTSPQPQVPVRRKSTIRYSDKPGVAQFREFADKLYAKRRVHERMNELIGGLVLDEELAAAGLRDANGEERCGWSAVHWRAPVNMLSTDEPHLLELLDAQWWLMT